ncbi:hypothetical protein ABPG74_013155 [Tetrahymena malaccensis]
MRYFAIPLLFIIFMSAATCQLYHPSWMTESQAIAALICYFKLQQPTCITNTCEKAYYTYQQCTQCESNIDTQSNYITCAKSCGTTFANDPTASSDSTVNTFLTGVNACYDSININGSTILVLSAFFIATFALLF